jgi:hypothetical protein
MMEAVLHARRLVLALIAAMLVALASFAGTASAANYVSLGDSYTAGPLIPNPVLPLGCLKSSNNYPHLAAPKIGLALKDPSCSGATTAHMTQQQNVEPDGPNPPQFNSLSAETEVVSLTIGGNDIGFTSIIENCITYNPFSSPCKNKYTAGGKDQISEKIAATAPKIAAVLQGIEANAPSADTYVLNYPAIFPETGSGCWPQMPISFSDDRHPGRGKRRHPRQLVLGEHRPRCLQGVLDAMGRTAVARRTGGTDSSQQSRHAGRFQRPRGGSRIGR